MGVDARFRIKLLAEGPPMTKLIAAGCLREPQKAGPGPESGACANLLQRERLGWF
jgi:hypothetical protein